MITVMKVWYYEKDEWMKMEGEVRKGARARLNHLYVSEIS